MTNPLQTRFQTPYKLGYIPCANRLHSPCTHIHHTPYGFAPAFGGGMQPPFNISADAPLTPILHLGRRNASRVPVLGCGWENLTLYYGKTFTGLDAATIELNFCVFMEVVVGWPVNIAFTKYTKAHPSCFRRRCQWALHSSSATSKQCACNTCNHNLSHIFLPYHDETNKLGSSGTPVVTDCSHPKLKAVTETFLGGCCLKCTHHRYAYKRIYAIINSMIPNKVDRSIV